MYNPPPAIPIAAAWYVKMVRRTQPPKKIKRNKMMQICTFLLCSALLGKTLQPKLTGSPGSSQLRAEVVYSEELQAWQTPCEPYGLK